MSELSEIQVHKGLRAVSCLRHNTDRSLWIFLGDVVNDTGHKPLADFVSAVVCHVAFCLVVKVSRITSSVQIEQGSIRVHKSEPCELLYHFPSGLILPRASAGNSPAARRNRADTNQLRYLNSPQSQLRIPADQYEN